MKFISLLFILIIAIAPQLWSQDGNAEKQLPIRIGAQLQVYPAGIIPVITAEIPLTYTSSLLLRAGLNIADRKNFSPYNDHESGQAYGGTIGLRKSWAKKKAAIKGGLNCDLWNMTINWSNNIGQINETRGSTHTFVVQPYIDCGYYYPLGNRIEASGGLGFGREINVITEGKKVAQGWMGSLLIGLSVKL
jgi:hypothetical protein